MRRRDFFKLGAGTTAAMLLSQCSRDVPGGDTSVTTSAPVQFQKVVSSNGLLSLDLEAKPQQVQLGDINANLLTYNGKVPGPLLEASPGDRVQIRFTNGLSQPTNIHYHGLHISPDVDNVFLGISPGEQHTYEFQIPDDHPAGTFWYHPHKHGLVAEQLFAGLAGLFIVRGELDEIPEIKTAQESFVVLKDFALDRSGNIADTGHMAAMTGRAGGLLTASGQINPEMPIRRGGLARLRLLNASPSRFYRLSLEDHPMHLIATDGGAIASPVELSDVVLAPGERVEVLVQGNQVAGNYRLINQPFNPAQGGMMGGMMGGNQSSDRSETVATLVYERETDDEETQEAALPSELITFTPLPEPSETRQFALNHGMGGMMGGGMVFLINGKGFDPSRIDTQVKLDAVEDWEITNTGSMAHPFHIHTNKFQIISQNGQSAPYAAWKDVVSVSPGETVRIRMAFRDYTGKTVYHCHVLDHEDRGMMGILEIQQA